MKTMKTAGMAWTIAMALLLCGGAVRAADIHDAVKSGDVEKVRALILTDTNLINAKNNDGWTPLHIAAANGKDDMAEMLLDHGADVNAKDNGGATPLLYAAMYGQKEVAQVLLDHGADVNAKTVGGMTPLHYAAMRGYTDLAELLLTHGADVNARDSSFGDTPLKWAMTSKESSPEMIDLLKAHGGVSTPAPKK